MILIEQVYNDFKMSSIFEVEKLVYLLIIMLTLILFSWVMFRFLALFSSRYLVSNINSRMGYLKDKDFNRFTIDYQRMAGSIGSVFATSMYNISMGISSLLYILNTTQSVFLLFYGLLFFMMFIAPYVLIVGRVQKNLGSQTILQNKKLKAHVGFITSLNYGSRFSNLYRHYVSNDTTELYQAIFNSGFVSQLFRKYIEFIVILGLIFVVLISQSSFELLSLNASYALAMYRIMPMISSVVDLRNQIKVHSETISYFRSKPNVNEYFEVSSETNDLANRILLDLTSNPNQGKLIKISGASGSGKSTLMAELHSMLQNQKIEHLYVGQTSGIPCCEIEYFTNIFEARQKVDIDRLKQVLSINHLFTARADLIPALALEKLSGGESQRLGLFCKLVEGKKIILLDEAFSSVDITTEHSTYKYLYDNSYVVVFISHSPLLSGRPVIEYDLS